MAQKGFFEESLKRFCNDKFGADSWVDGSYKDDMRAGTVEFTVLSKGFAKDAPVVSLEHLEELSLHLGTCHIALQPMEMSMKDATLGLVQRPGFRFAALRVAFTCPG